jgi:hypothetical protein
VNGVKVLCNAWNIHHKCDLFSWKAMNCSQNMFKVMVPIFNEAIYIYIRKKNYNPLVLKEPLSMKEAIGQNGE